MNKTRHMILGAFIAIAMMVLGYATLFLTEFSLFNEKTEMEIGFPNAYGLREGDTVLVAGLRWGKVGGLEYRPDGDPERVIRALVTLNEPLELREGYEIEIQDATLLGGRLIVIDPGPVTNPPVPADAPLQGSIAGNPLDALTELVDENGAKLSATLDNIQDFTGQLRDSSGLLGRLINDDALAEEFNEIVGNLNQVSAQIAQGEGTLGKLISDDELYQQFISIGDDLNSVFTDASALISEAREGRGLFSKLMNDEELAANVESTLADLADMAAALKAGEGTLGKLLTDDALYVSINDFMSKLNTSDGTLVRLLEDDTVYRDLETISGNLAEFSISLNNGEGTLARLMNDDELYQDLRQVLGVALRSLEEYREAAPVTTFTSVLFGAF